MFPTNVMYNPTNYEQEVFKHQDVQPYTSKSKKAKMVQQSMKFWLRRNKITQKNNTGLGILFNFRSSVMD